MNAAEKFGAFKPRQFELLLKERLSAAIEARPAERDRLCDFTALGVPMGDSYLDALVHLFNALPPPAQSSFHRALVALLRHAAADEFSAQGLSALLYLVGMTYAHDGLPTMVSVLDAGGWARQHPALIYDALSAMQMFPTSTEAYLATRRLCTAACFQDRFAFDAYQILLRGRPSAWFEDLRLLSGRFDRLVADLARSGTPELRKRLQAREQRLSRALASLVPLADLSHGLRDYDPALPYAARLLRGLFGQEGPLELVHSPEEGYLIVDRQDAARRAPVTVGAPLLVWASLYKLVRRRVAALRHAAPSRHEVLLAKVQRKLTLLGGLGAPPLQTTPGT